jgi:hypothetical protein
VLIGCGPDLGVAKLERRYVGSLEIRVASVQLGPAVSRRCRKLNNHLSSRQQASSRYQGGCGRSGRC